MSRKHFVAIADILKTQNASKELCLELAYQFKTLNSNFDITRFLNACGY
jgi:Golgi nucleoside diphosphatase